tara:strand:+ start:410 stop:727 length:318 start_codon:yes stop_codon:yes gene_type:complete
MAKTKEQLQTEADAEIEANSPLYKQVNNERMEFSDDDYAQAKIDLGNAKWEEQQFGYISARQEAYGSWNSQLDKLWHDIDAGKLDKTGEWYKAVKKVKTDNPKPS